MFLLFVILLFKMKVGVNLQSINNKTFKSTHSNAEKRKCFF
jgi:hypothetical protein